MSIEKTLNIGHERPKDTEVLVNSLSHLNTASLSVITKQRSQYISRLENVSVGQYEKLRDPTRELKASLAALGCL